MIKPILNGPITGRQLLGWLQSLTPDQLDNFHISTTEGCDENGNAEFVPANGLCVVGDGTVDSAASGVLEDGSPVILWGSNGS